MNRPHNDPEFDELKQLIRDRAPVTTDEIRIIVEDYFKPTHWSLLKEEWEKMSALHREALYSKLLVECVMSTTMKMKALKLDDIESDT